MSRKVVELLLEQNPPIQSYQDHAFWLSILLGNDPQLLPWLTMQYTNLIWKKDNQVLSPYIYSKWRFGTEEILPMEHFFNVSPSLFFAAIVRHCGDCERYAGSGVVSARFF